MALFQRGLARPLRDSAPFFVLGFATGFLFAGPYHNISVKSCIVALFFMLALMFSGQNEFASLAVGYLFGRELGLSLPAPQVQNGPRP